MNASKSSQIGDTGPICSPIYEFGQFRLDRDNRLLQRGEETIALTPKAFDVLVSLLERQGRLVTKDELMKAVWPETFVCESNLTQTIFMLRKALGESASEQRLIVTVPGRGYRLATAVRILNSPADGPTNPKGIVNGGNGAAHWKIWAVAVLATAIVFTVLFRASSPLPSPKIQRATQMPVSVGADPWQHLVSDGSRIFFLERQGDRSYLMETPIAGGETRRIAKPFPGTHIFDITRDNSEFLIGEFETRTSPEALWIWPVKGGAPVRVGQTFATHATWTPDGQEILYVN